MTDSALTQQPLGHLAIVTALPVGDEDAVSACNSPLNSCLTNRDICGCSCESFLPAEARAQYATTAQDLG